jgi:hypothetical protein
LWSIRYEKEISIIFYCENETKTRRQHVTFIRMAIIKIKRKKWPGTQSTAGREHKKHKNQPTNQILVVHAGIRSIEIRGQPRQIVRKTLPQKYRTLKRVAEWLKLHLPSKPSNPSKREATSSNPSTAKKKKKERVDKDRNLINCWQECKVQKLLQKTVWWVLRKHGITI